MIVPPDAAAKARDPLWLPHRYDQPNDAFQLVRLDRAGHGRVTFLNDDHLDAALPRAVVPRAAFLAAAPQPGPVHFLFHSAFCLSTLLARAFDLPGRAMGLKEPMLLQDVVGIRRRGAAPAEVGRLLNESLHLLARPLGPGEAVVIKPSNILNSLAHAVLTMRPQANALLLHAPLRTFLASVAKKEMWGRLWVRELFVGLLRDGATARLGFTPEDHLGQTDLQIAGLGWLAQHALFADLVTAFGPSRVRSLDSETLLARPRDTMRALFALFRLPGDEATIAEVVRGPAFARHSKTGAAFGTEARAEEYRVATAAHRDEIDKVAQWIAAVAKAAGVPLTPGAPLLG